MRWKFQFWSSWYFHLCSELEEAKDVGFAGRAITHYVTQDSNGPQMNKS
jgi:hypothetical protein